MNPIMYGLDLATWFTFFIFGVGIAVITTHLIVDLILYVLDRIKNNNETTNNQTKHT